MFSKGLRQDGEHYALDVVLMSNIPHIQVCFLVDSLNLRSGAFVLYLIPILCECIVSHLYLWHIYSHASYWMLCTLLGITSFLVQRERKLTTM